MVFFVFGLVLAGIISFFSYKEAKRNSQIAQEIDNIRQEAEKIRKNNQDLRKKISYFETPQFQEGVAKEKLNLQKPDEQVVIVRPSAYYEDKKEIPENEENKEESREIPNYLKWWNQFFKY